MLWKRPMMALVGVLVIASTAACAAGGSKDEAKVASLDQMRGQLVLSDGSFHFTRCGTATRMPVELTQALSTELQRAFSSLRQGGSGNEHGGVFVGTVVDGRFAMRDWTQLELGTARCDEGSTPAALGIRGHGTEPNWWVAIDGATARFHVGGPPLTSAAVVSTTPTSTGVVYVLEHAGKRTRVEFERRPTNDGMDDTLFPYTVTMNGLSGCGTL